MDSAFCGDDEGEGFCTVYEPGNVAEDGGWNGCVV